MLRFPHQVGDVLIGHLREPNDGANLLLKLLGNLVCS